MNQRSPAVAARPFLAAEWRYLAMLNYEIDPDRLAPLVPPGLELDDHAGRTYVSMVGFLFRNTRLWGLPVPGYGAFEEVNLRFYVRRREGDEVRRGVMFVRELVPRRAIAWTARWFYHEPYVAVPMRHTLDRSQEAPQVSYRWRWRGRWCELSLAAAGPLRPLAAGSLDEFIAEHYWGYCPQPRGGLVEYRVEHPSWSVWQAADARLDLDAAAVYGDRFADVLRGAPASALLADGSAVTVAWPRRLPPVAPDAQTSSLSRAPTPTSVANRAALATRS